MVNYTITMASKVASIQFFKDDLEKIVPNTKIYHDFDTTRDTHLEGSLSVDIRIIMLEDKFVEYMSTKDNEEYSTKQYCRDELNYIIKETTDYNDKMLQLRNALGYTSNFRFIVIKLDFKDGNTIIKLLIHDIKRR